MRTPSGTPHPCATMPSGKVGTPRSSLGKAETTDRKRKEKQDADGTSLSSHLWQQRYQAIYGQQPRRWPTCAWKLGDYLCERSTSTTTKFSVSAHHWFFFDLFWMILSCSLITTVFKVWVFHRTPKKNEWKSLASWCRVIRSKRIWRVTHRCCYDTFEWPL